MSNRIIFVNEECWENSKNFSDYLSDNELATIRANFDTSEYIVGILRA